MNEAIHLIGGGAQRGDNLFHSFEAFSIGAGGAYFMTPPGDVGNIFARVTGADPSIQWGCFFLGCLFL